MVLASKAVASANSVYPTNRGMPPVTILSTAVLSTLAGCVCYIIREAILGGPPDAR